MICNLFEINTQDQVAQIVQQIEYVLEYLNGCEEEAIGWNLTKDTKRNSAIVRTDLILS
jgi:hypothetical protein